MPNNPVGYIQRAKVFLSAAPTPVLADLPEKRFPRSEVQKHLASVRMQGLTTHMTSIAKADARTQALRERCEWLLRANRLVDLREFFADHPELAAEDWARKAALRINACEHLRQKRGRPRGSFSVHPLWIVGLVKELRLSREGMTLDEAFANLARRGIVASVDAAKEAYYSGLRDKRFDPVLVRMGPEFAISAEEYKARFGDSDMLKQG